jgi:tRNA (guanine-N7-)-methyltransferase
MTIENDPEGTGARHEAPRFQLYGRSKGKALRLAQARRICDQLPALMIDRDLLAADPARLFAFAPRAVQFEIGFGGGEHLAAMAKQNPEIGFLGVEPFLNGVAKLLAAIEADGLKNLRLLRGDAREILQLLPASSIDRLYLLYPDPWPKRRQRKRRIVDETFLDLVARALKPGAEFRFATDIDDYAGWTLSRLLERADFRWLAQSAHDWREPWPDWHRTRYEEKALREGREPGYFRFLRV